MVNNSLVVNMRQHQKDRGELDGYFELKGIKYGSNTFNDYWIYNNNISQEGYDTLMSINGTTEPSELRNFSKIRQYLHGHVRDIYYTSHDPDLDPRNTGANRIIYIYEGFYQNGKLSKDLEEIKFGRWFQTDSKCYIGYFTYDQQERDFLFFGKGMIIDG